VADTSITVPLE